MTTTENRNSIVIPFPATGRNADKSPQIIGTLMLFGDMDTTGQDRLDVIRDRVQGIESLARLMEMADQQDEHVPGIYRLLREQVDMVSALTLTDQAVHIDVRDVA